MPAEIRTIADRHLRNPLTLQVEERALTVEHIEQRWMRVPQQHKLDALLRLLRAEPRGTTLVFAHTRAGCADVADALVAEGFAADALHGDLDQSARERVVHRLRAKHLDVVVATDVAARGIDVEHLTHVINLDLPTDTEKYVHRIGRTGRAGAAGIAISLVTPRERPRLVGMQKRLGVRIPECPVPSDADIARKRRTKLQEALGDGLLLDSSGDAKSLVAELCSGAGWSVEDLAAGALRLLGAQHGIRFGEQPDERPPAWARPVEHKPVLESTAMVELFLPVGRLAGVGPGDIVGAITNAAGIAGSTLGKITVGDHKAFVQVTPHTAGLILDAAPTVLVRGQDVPIKRARPRSGGPGHPPQRVHHNKRFKAWKAKPARR